MNDNESRLAWFEQARFGLFIHWGLYSLAARHEWVQSRECIPPADYERYLRFFEPDLFDPGEWARRARRAGMRYMVVTSKHHEGFCLWDTALTDFKATNTPAGKDLLRPLLDAFRAEGLRVGLYHSLLDWHHPEFPLDGFHPLRDDPEARRRESGRDIRKYAEYLHGQVRELLTGYGKIDILWMDFSYSSTDWGWARGKGRDDWRSEELIRMVRELQPDIVLNDRLEIGGDFKTPEQVQPEEPVRIDGKPVLWEACQTFNGSWGYDRDNCDWKSVDLLVRMLVDAVSKGGNMLLNVGPTARGTWEPAAVERLEGIGEWMDLHGRSIYGCGPAPLPAPRDCRYTARPGRLYLHIFAWPFGTIRLPGLGDRVEYAQLLHDASEIRMRTEQTGDVSDLRLDLPVRKPPVVVPVVELFLRD